MKSKYEQYVVYFQCECLYSDYVATLVHNKLVSLKLCCRVSFSVCSILVVLGHFRRKAALWSRRSWEVDALRSVGQKNVTETCETDQTAQQQQTHHAVRLRCASADTFSHTCTRRKTGGFTNSLAQENVVVLLFCV